MDKTQATPLPWKFDGIDTIYSLPSDCEICTIRAIKDTNYTHGGKYNTLAMEANAALIVQSVNYYERMRDIIRLLIDGEEHWAELDTDYASVIRQAQAILRETEGK